MLPIKRSENRWGNSSRSLGVVSYAHGRDIRLLPRGAQQAPHLTHRGFVEPLPRSVREKV